MREFTKKSIVLLFTAAMIFTLAACGNGETTNINATNVSESESDARSESESDEDAEEEAPYSVGDSIYFGNYEQDGNEANGAESIEWLVLDQVDNRILVTSKYVLDCQAYHTESTAVTWEDCTLRAWLNGDFLNHAFSEEEQAQIITATVVNEDNAEYGISGGNNTEDKVFLPSVSEAEIYFTEQESTSSESGVLRKCKPTAYAAEKGAITVGGTDYCIWRLRTPGSDSDQAALVDYNSNIDVSGLDVTRSEARGGIRPTMWINLE